MPGGWRRWLFTVNNPDTEVLIDHLPEGVTFVIWSLEQGAQGTRHWQGYFTCKQSLSIGAAKRLFLPDKAHLEKANGTTEENIAYCTKEDTHIDGPWRFGEPPKPGERVDLQKLADLVTEKKTDLEIATEHPVEYMKYARHIKELRAALNPPARRQSVETCVLWGETGIGKTYWIYDRFPECYRVQYSKDRVWWDGYTGQDVIFFDEFNGQIPLEDMLQLLDPYPVRLEIKCSFTAAAWTKVVICSNNPPTAWYPCGAFCRYSQAQLNALLRRLTWVKEVKTREELGQIASMGSMIGPGQAAGPRSPSPDNSHSADTIILD